MAEWVGWGGKKLGGAPLPATTVIGNPPHMPLDHCTFCFLALHLIYGASYKNFCFTQMTQHTPELYERQKNRDIDQAKVDAFERKQA